MACHQVGLLARASACVDSEHTAFCCAATDLCATGSGMRFKRPFAACPPLLLSRVCAPPLCRSPARHTTAPHSALIPSHPIPSHPDPYQPIPSRLSASLPHVFPFSAFLASPRLASPHPSFPHVHAHAHGSYASCSADSDCHIVDMRMRSLTSSSRVPSAARSHLCSSISSHHITSISHRIASHRTSSHHHHHMSCSMLHALPHFRWSSLEALCSAHALACTYTCTGACTCSSTSTHLASVHVLLVAAVLVSSRRHFKSSSSPSPLSLPLDLISLSLTHTQHGDQRAGQHAHKHKAAQRGIYGLQRSSARVSSCVFCALCVVVFCACQDLLLRVLTIPSSPRSDPGSPPLSDDGISISSADLAAEPHTEWHNTIRQIAAAVKTDSTHNTSNTAHRTSTTHKATQRHNTRWQSDARVLMCV